MDFFTVPTVTFRVLTVWFMIHHGRRRIVHFNVTDNPTAPWVIQQRREAFPHETVPPYLVFDRDSAFAGKVTTTVENVGIKPKRTACRSPWQNGVAERWIGSCRPDLHVPYISLSGLFPSVPAQPCFPPRGSFG